ncbi:hypothetical protein BGX26_001688 [Mortierella sp. AD094]|nr:hypothetical protein BGX26_001688 [Mortierella sp. AD094]
MHLPYIWSIDVGQSISNTKEASGGAPKRIIDYTVSTDEKFIATLSLESAAETSLLLELWEIPEPNADTKVPTKAPPTSDNPVVIQMEIPTYSEKALKRISNMAGMVVVPGLSNPVASPGVPTAGTPQGNSQSELLARHPMPSAWSRIPIPSAEDHLYSKYYGVSVSTNASQIVFTDASKWEEPNVSNTAKDSIFAIFSSLDNAQPTAKSSSTSLHQPHQLQKNKSLGAKGFYGYGKFCLAEKGQDKQRERFIACRGIFLEVFKISPRWQSHRIIRIIPLAQPLKNPIDYFPMKNLIKNIRGKHFAWRNSKDCSSPAQVVSLWNWNTGSKIALLNYNSGPARNCIIAFSSDGSFIAISLEMDSATRTQTNPPTYPPTYITKYCTKTGALRGSFLVPDFCETILNIEFIRGDARLLVSGHGYNRDVGRHGVGLIVDATTMTLRERFAITTQRRQEGMAATFGDNLFHVLESSLDLERLENRILLPYSQPGPTCSEKCQSEQDPNSLQPEMLILTTPLGMQFSYEAKRDEIVVKLLQRELALPTFNDESLSAVFTEGYSHLVVISRQFVTIWNLPSSQSDSYTLLLAWKIPKVDDFWDMGLKHKICPYHLQICGSKTDLKSFTSKVEEVLRNEDLARPFQALNYLILMYAQGNDSCKNAILEYIGSHINSYSNLQNPGDNDESVYSTDICSDIMKPKNNDNSACAADSSGGCLSLDGGDECVLTTICRGWEPTAKNDYELFLKDLLESPSGRWIPQADKQPNPLRILIEKAQDRKQASKAIAMAEIIVDYCTGQARKEREPQFLLPIIQCLHGRSSHNQTVIEFISRALRRLAFIPAKSGSPDTDQDSIDDSSSQGQSLSDHRNHGRPFSRALRRLSKRGSPKNGYDPKNDSSAQEQFVTSFTMLWLHPEDKEKKLGSIRIVTSATLPWARWIEVLFRMLLFKISIRSSDKVKCHDFELEEYDNPAISALVDEKWKTIGFHYWMVRFFSQCFFYLLVLISVFTQVYSDHRNPNVGVFICIAIMSIFFLWLEFAQFYKDKKRYFKSIYNIVDIGAFGLPLVASIYQLVCFWSNSTAEANPGFLSFSVLIISLQFLFELRVDRNICHFVTIIIEVIQGSHLLMFLLVFTGGILAFTTAILHLLRSCSLEPCEPPTTAFPSNFFKAATATFYFTGGRYDPVTDDLSSDNWEFLIMMIVNFLFTGILMVNVLIALINASFDQSNESWRLLWIQYKMQYILAAENMNYHIREYYKWSPTEILYWETPQKANAYKAATDEVIRGVELFRGIDSDIAVRIHPGSSAEKSRAKHTQPTIDDLVMRLQEHGDDRLKNFQELKKICEDQKKICEDQKKFYEEQINDLKVYMSTLLASKPHIPHADPQLGPLPEQAAARG